jgi:hypothetical protein
VKLEGVEGEGSSGLAASYASVLVESMFLDVVFSLALPTCHDRGDARRGGFPRHMPKGCVYLAIALSVPVETLKIRSRGERAR